MHTAREAWLVLLSFLFSVLLLQRPVAPVLDIRRLPIKAASAADLTLLEPSVRPKSIKQRRVHVRHAALGPKINRVW